MLPYIQVEAIEIGGLRFEIFGLLVAIGCVAGYFVSRREAKLRGLDPTVIDGCLFWALIPGFLTSRFVALAFYHPDQLFAEPWSVLYFWASMSSFGGFIGGSLGVVGYFLYTRQPVIPYCECLVVGFAVGWFFGRLGCTIVHDHPGSLTEFPIGVRYPDGTRHDLGLYEWVFTILLIVAIFSIPRLKLPTGMLLGGVAIVYALMRFPLDFLRVVDARYSGLTFAQYACVVLLLVGIWLVTSARRRPKPVTR